MEPDSHSPETPQERGIATSTSGAKMDALVARLKEPSTYAGIAAIAVAVQHALATGHATTGTLVVAVAGALATVMSEKSS